MEDVAEYVDRIIVMNHGSVLYDDTPKEVFQHYQELEEIGLKQDEMHLVVELLKKKKYNADTATRQEQQKMYGFLYRKGFRSDIICRALSLDITSFSV